MKLVDNQDSIPERTYELCALVNDVRPKLSKRKRQHDFIESVLPK